MKNKKGFGFIPLLIVVAIVGAGVIGYSVVNKKSGGNSLKSLIPGKLTLNSNCKYNDPDLCRYINRALSGGYFKSDFVSNSVSTDGAGKKTKSMMEFQANGNMHFVTYDNDKDVMNMISMADATYIKDYSDGKWTKTKKETGKTTSLFDPEAMKKNVEEELQGKDDTTTYKKIGKEQCGSFNCFKYQMMLADMSDSIQYFYFDDQEYLMRKMRTEDKDGSVSETTFEYKKVSITAPTPIKEETGMGLPNIPGGNETINQDQIKKIQEELNKKLQESGSDTTEQPTVTEE